jgi:hypothetical protein
VSHPLSGQFRLQAGLSLPSSPLYRRLLEDLADDLDRGGVTTHVVAGHEEARPGTVLPLRLLGAVHRLVLTGALPTLAPFYPSVGGGEPPDSAWKPLRAVLAEHADQLRGMLQQPLQTNETGRAPLLYGGLMVVAQRTGLPVRLLEIGSSAGLNLLVDRYRYDMAAPAATGDTRPLVLGDPASALRFDRPWEGAPPADPAVPVLLVGRRGCDPQALDPTSAADRLTLTSFVWPDDVARLDRLQAALAVATAGPPRVDRASAAGWLADRLAEPQPGQVAVVWHSAVWQYLAMPERQQLLDVLAAAAQRATPAAPLAYLRYEPRQPPPRSSGVFELRLSGWPPGGSDELLATGTGHGASARWSR